MNMLRLHRIENEVFESNTYVVWRDGCAGCWLVDCGDAGEALKFAEANGLAIRGVLLTHGHFDHIYGLNALREALPEAEIVASEYAARQLFDKKLNYSHYHEAEFTLASDPASVRIAQGGERLSLAGIGADAEVVATPGHDSGCLSYIVGDYLFTGDAFIPGIRTVTSLRGNKQQAAESEERIKALVAERGLIVCPGHGEVANGLLTSL